MKNKYIIILTALIITIFGTYFLLRVPPQNTVEIENKVEFRDQELLEVKSQNDEVSGEEIENEQKAMSTPDELEDYKVLVGLIETYMGEIKGNKNPDAIDLMRQVEAKKIEYVALLNSIHNKESKEMTAKINKLNDLRDDLLELIDQLTMLKE